MQLNTLNALPPAEAQPALLTCNGTNRWATRMLEARPFASPAALFARCNDIWYNECREADWLEAFAQHPRIGDIGSLKEKYAATKNWAAGEQQGVAQASAATLEQLAAANRAYEEKFGFIFIVCATGKPAEAMLRLLQDRLENNQDEELLVAMGEQCKITLLRLRKLLAEEPLPEAPRSQVTTHVLDTSAGHPGQNISIRLKARNGSQWQTIAQGVTNADGRIAGLLPPGRILPPGPYQMAFDTGTYFDRQKIRGFYPEVDIAFTIFDGSHYHVPLLVNPFGYSTYRGS